MIYLISRNGAKLHKNVQGSVNVNPKILEDYFFEDCMEVITLILYISPIIIFSGIQ